MDAGLTEWTHLVVRWFHIFAGILWVGQTYFFTWLDLRFAAAEKAGKSAESVWMVHSGGFYVIEKQKVPRLLPGRLHWFRWEAALTWLSGMVLLVMVYYAGGALLDADVSELSPGAGAALGLGVLAAGWFVYDLLWLSPLARSEAAGAMVSYALLVAAAYGLSQVFSGRAAYMHVGALMGTVMAANVWVRILPAQRQMVAALQEGKAADLRLGAQAKLRSKHNTFLVVPVVFTMISSHFPVATYGNRHGWLILAGLILAGWAAAAVMRRRQAL